MRKSTRVPNLGERCRVKVGRSGNTMSMTYWGNGFWRPEHHDDTKKAYHYIENKIIIIEFLTLPPRRSQRPSPQRTIFKPLNTPNEIVKKLERDVLCRIKLKWNPCKGREYFNIPVLQICFLVEEFLVEELTQIKKTRFRSFDESIEWINKNNYQNRAFLYTWENNKGRSKLGKSALINTRVKDYQDPLPDKDNGQCQKIYIYGPF